MFLFQLCFHDVSRVAQIDKNFFVGSLKIVAHLDFHDQKPMCLVFHQQELTNLVLISRLWRLFQPVDFAKVYQEF